MAKNKGLGRGLDALLGGDESSAGVSPGNEVLRELSVEALQPGKYQPRTRMDQDSLAQLSESIKSQGVVQPILVRRVGEERYEIIAGERRWRAARMAGLTEIPALVREIPDEAAVAISLIENIQREDLNPLEEAAGIQRLIDEFKLTHQEAAEALGRSRSAVTNLLRLLQLAPPVQHMMMESQLDMGHARALAGLSHAQQAEVAHMVATKGLSVRETERVVQRLQEPAAVKAKPREDRDILQLQEELSERLGAAVSIRSGAKGKGKLVIAYSSLDQLDGILARLR